MLLSEGIECLVIVDSTNPSSSTSSPPTPSAHTTESAAAEPSSLPWIGLFDVRPIPSSQFVQKLNLSMQFSDVNAFLTLAATRHTLSPEVIESNERLHRIVEAAKAGRVDVRLVSGKLSLNLSHPYSSLYAFLFFPFFGRIDFSDKNPYVVLAQDANLVSVLEVFARGAHRGACMKRRIKKEGELNCLISSVHRKHGSEWYHYRDQPRRHDIG